MEKLKEYQELKKKIIFETIDNYNKNNEEKFLYDTRNFDIDKSLSRSELCKQCNGHCCKRLSCCYSPKEFVDFKNSEYMLNLFKTGLLTFGYVRSISVIRPIMISETKQGWKKIINNSCIFFKNNEGCLLPSLFRPLEGIMLVVNENPKYKYIDSYENYPHYVMYGAEEIESDYLEYQQYIRYLKSNLQDYKAKSYILKPSQIDNFINSIIHI